ncbi:hypothetical protein SEUCBS139899_010640 [Sporothrix eucalyptigena]
MDAFVLHYLSEALVVSIILLFTVWWRKLSSKLGQDKSDQTLDVDNEVGSAAWSEGGDAARDIVRAMEMGNKNCVVFFGSQTGTAESYALRLAKEGKNRFGLETMVANVEDYDLNNLDAFPEHKIALFVMSTYGEGEPPDSAVAFFDFITSKTTPTFTDGTSLANLRYASFGLGNKTYENYNAIIRRVTKALDAAGAKRLAVVGEADDGAGTTEEDFLAWEEEMWPAVAEYMGVSEHQSAFQPSFQVTECLDQTAESTGIYAGEPNSKHLEVTPSQIPLPFDAHNPYPATVTVARQLFSLPMTSRKCVHVEFDLSNSGLTYEAGDHLAIWPSNSDQEVDRILRTLGLKGKRQTVVNITSQDPLITVPFPTPTSYGAIMKHYLEIAAPVSRQMVSKIAPFAPTKEARDELARLGADKDLFHETTQYTTLARLLDRYGGADGEWTGIPFSLLVESLPKLQPRFYSISSSPLVAADCVSLTVAVKAEEVPGRDSGDLFYGVASNYLSAVSQSFGANGPVSVNSSPTYDIAGPRNMCLFDSQLRVPLHIRRSNFRLPQDPASPILMIGPGTGVAPFRGFVQERAVQASRGILVGPMLLFFGCRDSSEDFIYEDEWKDYAQKIGPNFQLFTAFSRQGAQKIYVQHLLRQRSAEVSANLANGAWVYVCGDARNMSRDVHQALVEIIAESRSVSVSQAEEAVKTMKSSGHYQEDVWS